MIKLNLDLLLVRIYIPERRMYQVRSGQRATISVEALPDKVFEGQIRMIGPEVPTVAEVSFGALGAIGQLGFSAGARLVIGHNATVGVVRAIQRGGDHEIGLCVVA